MTVTIQHYRTATPGAVPSASNVAQGQLALGLADGRVYTKDHTDSVVRLVGTLGNLDVEVLTAAEWDAIGTPDANTLYLIKAFISSIELPVITVGSITGDFKPAQEL